MDPTSRTLLPLDEQPSCLHTALVHLYRGEMNRMTTWRMRLDATSHWAILLATGLTTFALGSPQIPHFILLLGLAIITIFMTIEGRRYQHLHHSKWRLYLLEGHYFGQLLLPHVDPEQDWRQQLSADLLRPHFTITLLLAMRLRLRRNYLMLFYFTTAVWLSKVFIHPTSPQSVRAFYQRLAMGDLFPSWFVLLTAGLFLLGATLLAFLTPSEEALEKWTTAAHQKRLQTQRFDQSHHKG